MIQIGCIADDFTGASDWVSFFAEKGIKALLLNGVPSTDWKEDIDVAVIALKSRTIAVNEAVKESINALKWLRRQNTEQYYIKYCSTFDCTPKGNIGPIIDAAMDFLEVYNTIVCPALPINGRTVKDGKIYVNDVELQNSSMKNHPLTPMWDCRISELLKEQSKGKTIIVPAELYSDPSKAFEWIKSQCNLDDQTSFVYFIPDYYEQLQGKNIVDIFGNMKLLTGGSGLSTFLADKIETKTTYKQECNDYPFVLIAGSCSVATLQQIQKYISFGKKAVRIDPIRLLEGMDTVDNIWNEIKDCKDREILLYSSQSPAEVLKNQERGKEKISLVLENVQAELTVRFMEKGRKNIIVAGGETSGAIAKRLGFNEYYVGKSIVPGVPILAPRLETDIRLVLKSGNFGDENFFMKAIDAMSGR